MESLLAGDIEISLMNVEAEGWREERQWVGRKDMEMGHGWISLRKDDGIWGEAVESVPFLKLEWVWKQCGRVRKHLNRKAVSVSLPFPLRSHETPAMIAQVVNLSLILVGKKETVNLK